jgi:hypothetical protein
MKTSSLFSLDLVDLGKGLLVAAGGALVASVESTVQSGTLTFNWHTMTSVALAAGLSYLGKNFFTPGKSN